MAKSGGFEWLNENLRRSIFPVSEKKGIKKAGYAKRIRPDKVLERSV
jgi:hypothetical protein